MKHWRQQLLFSFPKPAFFCFGCCSCLSFHSGHSQTLESQRSGSSSSPSSPLLAASLSQASDSDHASLFGRETQTMLPFPKGQTQTMLPFPKGAPTSLHLFAKGWTTSLHPFAKGCCLAAPILLILAGLFHCSATRSIL